MEYTVGIVTYNRPDHIGRSLDSILAQTKQPLETIVVDDSTDRRTEDIVRDKQNLFETEGIELRYYSREDGRTMPGARNTVIREMSGDVVCFIDDDSICTPEWLEHIDGTYRANPDAAGVTGPALTTDEDLEPAIEILRTAENQNKFTRFGEIAVESERWVPREPVDVDNSIGANMSFRRTKLESIGGFDPDYKGPSIHEEMDVMARIRANDERIIYHPEVLVYHLEAASGGANRRGKEQMERSYWGARNLIRFRWKNFRKTFWIAFVRQLFYTRYVPAPVWKQLGGAFLNRDPGPLGWLVGYIDGLRKETYRQSPQHSGSGLRRNQR